MSRHIAALAALTFFSVACVQMHSERPKSLHEQQQERIARESERDKRESAMRAAGLDPYATPPSAPPSPTIQSVQPFVAPPPTSVADQLRQKEINECAAEEPSRRATLEPFNSDEATFEEKATKIREACHLETRAILPGDSDGQPHTYFDVYSDGSVRVVTETTKALRISFWTCPSSFPLELKKLGATNPKLVRPQSAEERHVRERDQWCHNRQESH